MAGDLNEVRNIYEKLWREAAAAFDRGAPRLDPFLNSRAEDPRRGVTLIARPDGEVRGRIENFLREIESAAPDQYFYQPAQVHLTVLSVIPGSGSWRESARRLPDYLAVLDGVLKNRRAFSVAFRGVTASPEAVMVQGFPGDPALAELRGEMRAALSRQNLGDNLDRRYKMVTAHLTVARFATPLADWQPLKALLGAHRNTDFGEMRAGSLQLIEGDWYAFPDSVRTLREYPLLQ